MQGKQKTTESYRSGDRAEPEALSGADSIAYTKPEGKGNVLSSRQRGKGKGKVFEPPCTERYARWCERADWGMTPVALLDCAR